MNELLKCLKEVRVEDCHLLRKRIQLEVVGPNEVDIELTFNDLEKNQIISREMWTSEQPVGDQDSVWHFCYSISRGGHLQASLVASGSSTFDSSQQKLADLLGILQALCLHWPPTAATDSTGSVESHLEMLPSDQKISD